MVKLALRTPQKRKKYRPPANRKKNRKKNTPKKLKDQRLILLLCVVYIISLIHLYMYMHQMKPKCSFFKMTVTVNSYVQTNMHFKDRIQVRGFNTYRPCFNH